MPTQTKRVRRPNKPTLHTEETKVRALREVQNLINDGMSQFRAQSTIAKKLHVTAQTVINWFNKYNLVTEDHISSNHVLTSTGRLAVQSLNIKTIDGKYVTLTPADIKGIAEYAPLV